MRGRWLIPVGASVAAVALFAAGVVAWRMRQPLPTGWTAYASTANHVTVYYHARHRLHPLRAEALWAAGAVFALVALATGLRARRRPDPAQPATN